MTARILLDFERALPVVRRVELAATRARRAGEGPKARWEAYAADAVVAVAGGGAGAKRSDRADLTIVCDLAAWRRGHTHEGEACHLIGGGPLPVGLAQQLGQDAFVQAVLHDGVAIHTVTRFGRHLPAELRAALDLGPVPEFTGRACVDCGRRWGLDYDHVDPVANRGPTSYDNLQARCWPCHHHKTEQDRKAGLLGPHAPRPPNRSQPPRNY
jgi:5-methylcytosine-specific restriction endonuclease McrA